ncbi:MAG: transferase spermidine synthase [Pseudomonadota bacterium]
MDLTDNFAMFSNRFARAVEESQGKPFTFDHDGMRTLHLDGRFIQSAMRLSAPNELLLSYTKAMTAFLLLKPAPRHILMIGLGGGSLAKYCYQQLPATRITVLESEADVIALRGAFAIPADDDRFQVLHADAASYLAAMTHTVDVILHDGFDADGLAPGLGNRAFYLECERVLDQDGILVANLLGDTDELLPTMLDLHAVFGQALWWADAAACFNRIVLAKKQATPVPPRAELLRMAAALELRGAPALNDFIERTRSAWGKTRDEFAMMAAYDLDAAFVLA